MSGEGPPGTLWGPCCPRCGQDPLQWCLSDGLPFPSLPLAFHPSIPVPRKPKFPTSPHPRQGERWGWGDRGVCPEPRPSQDAEAGASLSRSLSLESPLDQTGPQEFCFVIKIIILCHFLPALQPRHPRPHSTCSCIDGQAGSPCGGHGGAPRGHEAGLSVWVPPSLLQGTAVGAAWPWPRAAPWGCGR